MSEPCPHHGPGCVSDPREGQDFDWVEPHATEAPETVTTVACRACSAGWYGKAGDRCPRCNAVVVVTDTYTSIDLRRNADA